MTRLRKTSRPARASLIATLALGASISLVGCSADSTDDPDSSQAEQTPASEDGEDGATPSADSEGFVDDDGEVPGWFADGFPIFPGSVVAGSGESGDTTIISFSVPSAEAQEIYDWFVGEYGQNGWESRNLDAENMSLDADHTDGRSAAINVTDATFVLSATEG